MNWETGAAMAISFLLLCATGCAGNIPPEAMRQEWDAALQRGVANNNEVIHTADYGTGVWGYRMWQGSYRGVPIALYSCVLMTRKEAFGPSSVHYVSVLLVVEKGRVPTAGADKPVDRPGQASGPVQVMAEQQYRITDLKHKEDDFPPPLGKVLSLGMDVGGITVAVRDGGEGRLGYRLNVMKDDAWGSFDLEQALADYRLAGPRTIAPLAFPAYTPDEFAKVMRERLGKLEIRGQWPTPAQMAEVDHPLWRDPKAMGVLLSTASDVELARALRVMTVLAHKYPQGYFPSLAPIDQLILSMADHKSQEVRSAFAILLDYAAGWPRDPTVLEPLLKSSDPEIVVTVLTVFLRIDREHVPRDLSQIETLAKSDNKRVSEMAAHFLELARKGEYFRKP